MPDLIADFYRQNEWANLQILERCRGLTDEQLDATAEGTAHQLRQGCRFPTHHHHLRDRRFRDVSGGHRVPI